MNDESELLQSITMREVARDFVAFFVYVEEFAAPWFAVFDNGRPVAVFESWRDAYRFRMALIIKRLDEQG